MESNNQDLYVQFVSVILQLRSKLVTYDGYFPSNEVIPQITVAWQAINLAMDFIASVHSSAAIDLARMAELLPPATAAIDAVVQLYEQSRP